MKARGWIAVLGAAIFVLTSCAAFGQGKGRGKGNGKDKDDDSFSERVEFRKHDRDSMNDWYREHEHGLD